MKKSFDASNIIVTLLIFLIIWLISIIPYKLFFLDPLAKAVGDFELNDIVFSKLQPEREIDTNIVLVNIGNFNRKEIANQISILNSFGPKVIGVDAIFAAPTIPEHDSLLRKSFAEANNIVLVGILDKYNESSNFYNIYVEPDILFKSESVWGYANLPTKFGEYSKTIRNFRPYSLVKNEIVSAFSVRIVEIFDKSAYQNLVDRANNLEVINYRGNTNKFITLDTDVFESPNVDLSFIEGKIVLMGYLGNTLSHKTLEDIYFSPLNEVYAGRSYPDMYGVTIHANIMSMLLENDYIDLGPFWLSTLLAVMVVYMTVVYLRKIRKRLTDYYGGIAKLIIFVQSVIILIINVYLLLAFQYKMSFTLMLVGLVLIPSTVLLYDNLLKHLGVLIYQKFFDRISK